MSTVTSVKTLKDALNEANPGQMDDAMRQAKMGDMMEAVDELISITSGTVITMSSDTADKRGALMIQAVEVIAGTATGHRNVGASSVTPTTAIVAWDPAAQTLTFEAAITQARVTFVPAPSTALSDTFPTTGVA